MSRATEITLNRLQVIQPQMQALTADMKKQVVVNHKETSPVKSPVLPCPIQPHPLRLHHEDQLPLGQTQEQRRSRRDWSHRRRAGEAEPVPHPTNPATHLP